MVVSEKILDQLSDTKTIGRSAIGFINGILCIVLTIISGTSNVSSAKDAIELRNLAVGFGATVACLNLILAFIMDVLISCCSTNATDEATLVKIFKTKSSGDKIGDKIGESTQKILPIIQQLKLAANNLDTNDTEIFQNKLLNIEDILNKLEFDV